MKTTENISLAGYAFTIETDAYEELGAYLSDIRTCFSGDASADEIVADIEERIAELLRERCIVGMVVDLPMVLDIKKRIGDPKELASEDTEASFETKDEAQEQSQQEQPKQEKKADRKNRRIYRNMDERVLGGVCSGLGTYFGLDKVLFRIIFLVIFFIPESPKWLIVKGQMAKASAVLSKIYAQQQDVDGNHKDEHDPKGHGRLRGGHGCQQQNGEAEDHGGEILIHQIVRHRGLEVAVDLTQQNNAGAGGAGEHAVHGEELLLSIGREQLPGNVVIVNVGQYQAHHAQNQQHGSFTAG